MRLRNKKTGKSYIVHIGTSEIGNIHLAADDYIVKQVLVYETLAELNEDWEDYKPAEPLIKDEKTRKAVRAWAEANGFLDEIEAHSLTAGTRFSIGHFSIEFLGYFIYDLESNKTYTLAELCGEEE